LNVASERQIAANRRNARKSTGPRSHAGKRRASRNAYRHGLTLSTSSAPAVEQIEQLAREIAGSSENEILLAHARTIAEAVFDLARIRQTKVSLIERIMAMGALDPMRYRRPLYGAREANRLCRAMFAGEPLQAFYKPSVKEELLKRLIPPSVLRNEASILVMCCPAPSRLRVASP
jgi:hypothetical protein